MARWRSASVTLVLVGAGIAACTPEPTYRRNVYASRKDCTRDYAAEICGPASPGMHGFYGPIFWAGGGRRPVGDPGPGASAPANASSRYALQVSAPMRASERGGFGDTGRSYRGSAGRG